MVSFLKPLIISPVLLVTFPSPLLSRDVTATGGQMLLHYSQSPLECLFLAVE